jgi:hypothetical protein
MNEFEILRAEVLDVTEDVLGVDVVYPLGADFEPLRERLADGSLRVVVFGEFRRGKSTLLNTLVHRDLFPVDLDVTTAAVTTLEWGNEDRAIIHRTSRAGPLRPDEVPMEQVREYVTEQLNPENRRGVILVELHAPVDELASGLVLVDTPGLGSVNRLHSAATREYLKRADAVVFVASAVQPLGEGELRYLKAALGHTSRFLTALTMSDLIADIGPVVAEARRRIAEAVGMPTDDLAIFPVSALMRRAAAEEDDADLLAASGFPELETALWARLSVNCAVARLKPVISVLKKLLDQATAGIATEVAGLDDDREQRRITRELQAEQSRLITLGKENTTWRQQMAEDLGKVAEQVRARLDGDFAAIHGMVNLEACRSWASDTSAVPVDQITLAISQAVESAARIVATAAQDTGKRYSAAGTIHLTVNGSPVTLFSPDVGVPRLPDLKPQRIADAVLTASTGKAGDVGIFYVLFAAAGAIAMPGIGVPALLLALGRLFDQVTVVLNAAKNQLAEQHREQLEQRAEAIRDALTRAVDLNRQRAQDQIEDLIRLHVHDLTEQIDRWYENARRLAQETITQYEENQRGTARDREVRRGGLKRKAATLAELSGRIESLENRVNGLGEADGMSLWAQGR